MSEAVRGFAQGVLFLRAASEYIAADIRRRTAGTFSNVIANAGSTVLSRSPHCGIWNQTYINIAAGGIIWDDEETVALCMQYINKQVQDIQVALNYAQTCYSAEGHSISPNCKSLHVPKLDYTAHDTSCPFEQDLCSSEGITFETAVLDSRDVFGINAKFEDRITYQRRSTCAVVNGTGRVLSKIDSTDNTDLTVAPQNISYAYYGPSVQENTTWTFSYNNLAQYYTNYSAAQMAPYLINVKTHYADDPTNIYSGFEPINGLASKSADLSLMLMSYVGDYLNEVGDPWFSAHYQHHTNTSQVVTRTKYAPDKSINALGCVEQHQFCTSTTCTPFLGLVPAQSPEAFVATLTPRQNVTYNRIWNAAGSSFIGPVVQGLNTGTTPVLAALQTVQGAHTIGLGLPDDQWQSEVRYWYNVSMALFQQQFTQYNTGRIAADTKYFLPPESEAAAWWCQNLMIPSTEFQSFSVLTLILILVFGTLIILSSLMIEQLASWAQKWSGSTRSLARRESWDNDDMLILQDRANEKGLWKPPPPPKDRHPDLRQQRSDAGSVSSTAPPPYRTRSDLEEQKILDSEKSRRKFMQSWI